MRSKRRRRGPFASVSDAPPEQVALPSSAVAWAVAHNQIETTIKKIPSGFGNRTRGPVPGNPVVHEPRELLWLDANASHEEDALHHRHRWRS